MISFGGSSARRDLGDTYYLTSFTYLHGLAQAGRLVGGMPDYPAFDECPTAATTAHDEQQVALGDGSTDKTTV